MKKVSLSVQEFAFPSPLRGSIEGGSGLMNAAEKGIELHQMIQKERAREFDHYMSEVSCGYEFEDEYIFAISGRMDGVFEGEPPLIEEIKSSFNVYDLQKTIRDKWMDHPYVLQVMTYGYFYWKKTGVVPLLSLHLISSRNQDRIDVEVKMNLRSYEEWLERRLSELKMEARLLEKRIERRKKVSKNFPFPFENPRPGQIDLIKKIEDGMIDKKHLMLQAPTGLGKTVGVLYPTLKESMSRGESVIYVTPKNSQQGVAEEAVEKFQGKGCQVKSLTLTAKSKLCMKAEPLCNPEYCEFARDHYTKVHDHGLKAELLKKKKITSRVMKTLANKYEVCPFELQLEAVAEADTVICDYNYAFTERSPLGRIQRMTFEESGKPNLVIDEAHNLPSRAMGYYSSELSSRNLDKMRLEIELLPKKFAQEGEDLLTQAMQVIRDSVPDNMKKSEKVEIAPEPFLEMNEVLKGFLSRYLDSDVEIKARDVVLRFIFYWGEFTDVLEGISGDKRPEFFTSFIPDSTGGTIKITCCDASEMIRPRFEKFEQVVAFSATLKPFDYYSKLSGLESPRLETSEFQTPFEKEKRKIMVIPQISTKYSDRDRSYGRIAETLEKVISLRPGNYLAFFPSFDFMEKTYQKLSSPDDFQIIRQSRFMKNDDVLNVLDELKSERVPTLLMGVQGGVFSEGVDYPGDMVIGAFIVGPPLPNFDFEREGIKDFYQQRYQKGFDYAYTYPAMAKAVQAAGRVIRSERDRGIIILMDDRFLEPRYSEGMPRDWFTDHPRELVSKSILTDLKVFWEKNV
jgi:DNA excision repair protein ERCC-2